MQAVFDIGVPILGALIWTCPNSILLKILTNSKCNSSFLIISQLHNMNIVTKKQQNNCNV